MTQSFMKLIILQHLISQTAQLIIVIGFINQQFLIFRVISQKLLHINLFNYQFIFIFPSETLISMYHVHESGQTIPLTIFESNLQRKFSYLKRGDGGEGKNMLHGSKNGSS